MVEFKVAGARMYTDILVRGSLNCTTFNSLIRTILNRDCNYNVYAVQVGTVWMCLYDCRCVHLLAKISKEPRVSAQVESLLPILAEATRARHYPQYLSYLETVLIQVCHSPQGWSLFL